MGLSLMGKASCSKSYDTRAQYSPPEPDPKQYRILEERVCNGKSILLVYYPNCTTFNGQKLLLLKNKWNPKNKTKLDPHLLGNGHQVIARFEPNPLGWKLARECCYLF